ncbi:MAG: PAS domain-containing protein, partial [Actinomycetota bacterium]
EGVQVDVSARHSEVEDLRIVAFLLEEQVAERTAELTEANQFLTLEIDERRAAEEALEASRRNWRQLVEELPLVVFTWSIEDARMTYVSPRMRELFGYDPEACLRADRSFWLDVIDPKDRSDMGRMMSDSARDGVGYDVRYRFRCADGRVAWVRERITPLEVDADGKALTYLGFMSDITFAVEREMAIAAAEERFRTLTSGVPAWLYSWTVVDGLATGGFTSTQAATDFGFDPEIGTAVGEAYWRQFVHADDADRVFATMRRCAETGEPFEDLYRWILPDGRTIWMLDRARATRWDAERREGEFHGVMVDVTDLVEGRATRAD